MFAYKTVVAVDPKTGSTLWSYPWETKYDTNAADPILIGDKVFISSQNLGNPLTIPTSAPLVNACTAKRTAADFGVCAAAGELFKRGRTTTINSLPLS